MDKFVRIVCDLLLLLLLLFGPFRPLIRFLPNNRRLLLIRLLTFAWLKTPSASSFFALFYVIEDILLPSLFLSLSLYCFLFHIGQYVDRARSRVMSLGSWRSPRLFYFFFILCILRKDSESLSIHKWDRLLGFEFSLIAKRAIFALRRRLSYHFSER